MSATSNSEHERPPGASFRARFLLLSISVTLALLVVEGAVRVRQWTKYGRAEATTYELTEDPATGLRILKPLQDTGRIRIDSRGFRNPEIEMPKPPGRIRVAFVGASTTFCAEVSSNEATWPSLVTRELGRRYPKLSFDHVNAGVPGYGLEAESQSLREQVAPLQPDVVVFYEGANELSYDTREVARRSGLFSGKAENPSPLARISVAWFLVEKNLLVRKRQRDATTRATLRYNADSLAQGFRAGLVEFLTLAKQVAPVSAVATFSHKVRRDQAPETQLRNCNTALYYSPYMSVAGLLDGFDAYNRAIRSAAAETGVILIEGENDIPGDDVHFADSVHFLDPGAQVMARRVVDGLVTSPQFDSLITSRPGPGGS